MDDESGASITCCVNPAKVYAREISDSKRRQASYHSSRRNGHAIAEGYSTTDSESVEDDSLSNATPRTSRSKRGSDDDDEDNEDTPRKVGESKPKFDPRLWIYRYKEPPRPSPSSSTSTTSSNPSSFEIPLYKEGTILRIIGKIFLNTTRGNERQIEVSSIECVYEEGYINEYRRKVPPKGNKYVEWHHAVKCRKKRKECFGDKEKVRAFIGFGVPKERDGEESLRNSQSTTMQDVTMQDVTLVRCHLVLLYMRPCQRAFTDDSWPFWHPIAFIQRKSQYNLCITYILNITPQRDSSPSEQQVDYFNNDKYVKRTWYKTKKSEITFLFYSLQTENTNHKRDILSLCTSILP